MITAPSMLRGLYALTDSTLMTDENMLSAVEQALRGGAHLVQYRDKSPGLPRRRRQAQALLQLCHDHDVRLLINDDVGLAQDIGADGVHLGLGDTPIDEARMRLGPRALIGVSCYSSLPRALAASRAGADYVAFGSFFRSSTKPEAPPAPLQLLQDARRQLSVPVCAIGGITPDNGAVLLHNGADMLAAISGLFAQPDIRTAAQRYARLFG